MALQAGIYDAETVPSETYHADQLVDVPTLSRSIAHTLVSRTPRHAWWQHPRLNPDYQPKASGTLDHGSAVHALLFEGKLPEICDFPDWRTNAAKDARDDARKAGRLPLLKKDAEVVNAMCEAITAQLEAHHPRPFTDGKAEQTVVWCEDGAWCRIRADWLTNDFGRLWDLKTTGTTADPRDWSRRLIWDKGLDIQCSLYRRGVRAVTGVTPDWGYVVVENTPPYALSVISLTPDAIELADEKVEKAIALWRTCLERDEWPAYPTQTAYAELPPWESTRWAEREALEEMAEEVAA